MSLTAMTHTNQFWDAKSFKYLHRWRCRQSKLNWNLTSKNMYHTGETNEKQYFFFSQETVSMWTRQIYKFLQIAQSKNSTKTIISKTFIFKDDSEPILWSACCFFSYTFRCEKMEDHKTGDNYNMFFSHKNKKPFNKQSKELHKINNFPACLTNLRTAGRKKKSHIHNISM